MKSSQNNRTNNDSTTPHDGIRQDNILTCNKEYRISHSDNALTLPLLGNHKNHSNNCGSFEATELETAGPLTFASRVA